MAMTLDIFASYTSTGTPTSLVVPGFNTSTTNENLFFFLGVTSKGVTTSPTITGITGAGLTFTRIATGTTPSFTTDSTGTMHGEVWWAEAPAQLTSQTFTAALSGAIVGGSNQLALWSLYAFKGSPSPSSPWDAGSLPLVVTNASGTPTTTFNTSNTTGLTFNTGLPSGFQLSFTGGWLDALSSDLLCSFCLNSFAPPVSGSPTPVYWSSNGGASVGAGGTLFPSCNLDLFTGNEPFVPPLPPGVPIDTGCGVSSTTSVTLMWAADPSGGTPTSYTLMWATAPGGPYTTVSGITETSYAITGLAADTTVYWQVQAVGVSGTSAFTAITTCSSGILSTQSLFGWRGLVGINWLGMPLIGDQWSPVVGLSNSAEFTEYGHPMVMTVTTPPLQDDRKRIFITRFEIDMQVGDGLPNNPAEGGTVLMSVSKDGGMTFGTLMKPRSMGAVGQYRTRLRWLNLGQARTWVFKLVISDPVRRQIIGAYWTGYKALG